MEIPRGFDGRNAARGRIPSSAGISIPESRTPWSGIILYMTEGLMRVIGWVVAWGWTIVAGGGGLGLLIMQGPWPPTNGWFALFSGLSGCPLTAWLLQRYHQVHFPAWARFMVALLFFAAGRFALVIEGRGTFLPNFSH